MQALICETVTGGDMAELLASRDAVSSADLVELRLDGVRDLDVAGALANRRLPVVVTCRAAWEGGRFDGAEERRLAILREAARLGAEFVDVEWRAARRADAGVPPERLVLSHHDFDGIPGDLADRVRAMRAERPAVVKVAVRATRLADVRRLRDAVMSGDGPRHAAIAMGEAGLVTRVHPALFGSSWTYAGAAAPGQRPARELRDIYRVGRTTAATSLYGVTGLPLTHSASPAMHNAAFAAMGEDAVYAPLPSDDAGEVIDVAGALHVRGLSVTAPLKAALRARVSGADALVEATGAVNTLRWGAGGLEGRNFDVEGFLAPLVRHGVRLDGRPAVVLGAGGAARAAAIALRGRGARVAVAARRADRARALADQLGVGATAWPPPPGWELLVHATPAGTWPRDDESPLGAEALGGAWVYDLVYNPEETRLLRLARQAGAATIGGLDMLVAQARLQIEWWTGRTMDETVLRQAARNFLHTPQVTTR